MSETVLRPLLELTLIRIRGFLREPEVLFWSFVFPILVVMGLGLAFSEKPPTRVRVAVERGSAAELHLVSLRSSPDVEVRLLDSAVAQRALWKGKVDIVLAGRDTLVHRYDPGRVGGRLAHLIADDVVQRGAGFTRPVHTRDESKRPRGGRYIDWLVPGLIGLNLMSTGMWSTGVGLVQTRRRKLLKLLSATPMRRTCYVLALILARLWLLIFQVPLILASVWLVFGVRMQGSALEFSGIIVLGVVTFTGLGMLAASQAGSIEGVSGILEAMMLPMLVLSGVFFSSARYPDAIQPIVQALPLTALNDALRAVFSDGISFESYLGELAILVAWAATTYLLASRIFRWR